MKRLLLGLMTVLLLFALVGCGSNTDTSTTEAEENSKESTQTLGEKMKDPEREQELAKQMNLTVGENATVDGIDVKLDRVYLTEGNEYDFEQLKPNYIYMVCQLTVTNTGKTDFTMYNLGYQMYADNSACETVVVNYSDETHLTDVSNLAPGTNTTGVIDFEVPQSASKFQLKVSPKLNEDQKKDIIFNFDTSQVE